MDRDRTIEKLKQQIQAYEALLKQLPFSFTYKDSETNWSIMKKEENMISSNEQEIIDTSFTMQYNMEHLFEYIEKQLLSIIDLITHHIVFINNEGVITLCNLQTARDFQVVREDIIGAHIRDLLKIPDDQIYLLQTLRTGRVMKNKEVFNNNYGLLSTQVIRAENGEIQRVIGTFEFLEGVKRSEKQALAGRIAAGIAHEIRNPLTTVRGYLQLWKSRSDQEFSLLVENLLIPEIDRANKIITDFLRIAKPNSSATEIYLLNDLCSNYIRSFLSTEALFHNVSLTFHTHKNIKDHSIKVDREELLQVFINLFRNSLESTKHAGLLKLQIDVKKAGDFVLFVFKDNGGGIPKGVLRHIFDPFFSTKEEGTGLGLSVSRKIIENHQGTINATSDQNGTVFYIKIPLFK
ncbi:ATP-binding protein [Bacillus carboniphilus]|uniref:histidine kinase n=1 Tax=Bacillus carboniphilus TaxID=86663 RepID=A0ABY9K027_9BACI|nr:ATP-binding protein [Bacillus carboniphilus]WLR43205.1 ATP-binding protein [Bacillus carboniphilus]